MAADISCPCVETVRRTAAVPLPPPRGWRLRRSTRAKIDAPQRVLRLASRAGLPVVASFRPPAPSACRWPLPAAVSCGALSADGGCFSGASACCGGGGGEGRSGRLSGTAACVGACGRDGAGVNGCGRAGTGTAGADAAGGGAGGCTWAAAFCVSGGRIHCAACPASDADAAVRVTWPVPLLPPASVPPDGNIAKGKARAAAETARQAQKRARLFNARFRSAQPARHRRCAVS